MQSSSSADRIPVLPIRSTVVFPGGATALQIGFGPNVEALAAHPAPELEVATATTHEDGAVEPATLERIASVVRVLDRLNLPGGTTQVTLQGLRRARLQEVRLEEGFYTAVPVPVEEVPAPAEVAEPLVEKILNTLLGVAARVERISDEVPRILRMNLSDPGRFADLAATLCNFKVPDRDAVLQELDVAERLRVVLRTLEEELEHLRQLDGADGTPAGAAPLPARGRERSDQIRKRIQALQAELGDLTRWSARPTRCCARWSAPAFPRASPRWPGARRSGCAPPPSPPPKRPRSAPTWTR